MKHYFTCFSKNIWVVKEEYPLKQGLKRLFLILLSFLFLFVKEEYPLKQGLKLKYHILFTYQPVWRVKEEYPLKQGLKHPKIASFKFVAFSVKEEYPLKQGLKQSRKSKTYKSWRVKEEYPLKQGLKLTLRKEGE